MTQLRLRSVSHSCPLSLVADKWTVTKYDLLMFDKPKQTQDTERTICNFLLIEVRESLYASLQNSGRKNLLPDGLTAMCAFALFALSHEAKW